MKTKKHISLPIEILQTKTDQKIDGYRYGKILEIDETAGVLWVDYADNPLKEKLSAQLASPYLTLDNLREASVRPNIAQLEFVEGNPAKPLVRDIYFSLVDQAKEKRGEIVQKTIRLKADRIVLEGDSEVIIKSGNVKTVYKAVEGKLVEEADDIRSTARRNNKVQGGVVLIN